MKHLGEIAVCALLTMVGCAPYPEQLGVAAPPPFQHGIIATELVRTSAQPLYRTRSRSGPDYPNVVCFGPLRFEIVDGPMGSLVWTRLTALDFEMEAIVRPALSIEDYKAIVSALPADISRPVLIVPCPLNIIQVSPLAQFPPTIRTSFGYGKDGMGNDVLVVRFTAPSSNKEDIEKMLSGSLGAILDVDYSVDGHSEMQNAVISLRAASRTTNARSGITRQR